MTERKLTIEECKTIIASLRDLEDRMRHYPYQQESQRRTSVAPVEKAIEAVREIRDQLKAVSK